MYIKNIITENNIITYSMQENNANVVAIESLFEFILFIPYWWTVYINNIVTENTNAANSTKAIKAYIVNAMPFES